MQGSAIQQQGSAIQQFWTEDVAPRAGREEPDLRLDDGSRVAVVGGGPAGSFFAYFLLGLAKNIGLELQVDVFEPRHFTHCGPAGCNHCGGIVSESLVQLLATEGINLPSSVVQRGIDSYVLHLDVGTVRIDTPLQEKRIAAVFRGNGPRDAPQTGLISFDRYLQDLAVERGARVVRKLVSGIEWESGYPYLQHPDGAAERYDLAAIGVGINSNLLKTLETSSVGYRRPRTTKTYICEFLLGQETVQKYLGPSMHVFLLDLPRLEFAALIPKGEVVTMCLLGDEIDDELVQSFLNSPEVRDCFPPGTDLPDRVCNCSPLINVHSAVKPFGDRLVVLGDSGVTRLYKDGIGAAYRTAKAAATTAALHGVSAEAFRTHYWQTCRAISADNRIGKFVFAVNGLLQKRRFSRRAVLRMTALEQQGGERERRMSRVLWDLFTGSAPYREVLANTMRPAFIAQFSWSLMTSLLPAVKRPPELRQTKDEGQEHARAEAPRQPEQMQKLPPCHAGCAAGTDVRGWVSTIAQRRKLGLSDAEAYALGWQQIVDLNPFPAVMGRVCPHPCESDCNRTTKGGAVAVHELERFIGDWGLRAGLSLQRLETDTKPESIGVIGAGPAGLSFAYQMARRGYEVTLYERYPKAGGMLRYGIPVYRLPENVLDAEIQRILELGVELKLATRVGQDITIEQLESRHSIVFLGIGAHQGRLLDVPGETGPGVWAGTEYLNQVNRREEASLGRRVAVIGGGNTAVDAARAARRTGAEVTVLYRRTRAEMPAIERDIDEAAEEGIRIEYLVAPVEIIRKDERVESLVVKRMELGAPDASGRRRPVPVPDSEFRIPVDAVIAAISQQPDWSDLESYHADHSRSRVDPPRVDQSGKIADQVWAGGDVLHQGIAGAAIANGRWAAEAVHARLRNLCEPVFDLADPVRTGPVKLDYFPEEHRLQSRVRPVSDRLREPETEINLGITEAEFLEEVSRCLSCGECSGCEQCWMYCAHSCFTRLDEVRPGAYFALSLDSCQACGKCIDICPSGFLQIRASQEEGHSLQPNG